MFKGNTFVDAMQVSKFRGFQMAIPITMAILTVYGLLIRPVEIGSTIYEIDVGNLYKSELASYCILPYVTFAAKKSGYTNPVDVTLVTQGSIDHLLKLATSSRLWNGPVSAAIFVPEHQKIQTAYQYMNLMSACYESFREKVSVHFFYSASGSCTQPERRAIDQATMNCSQIETLLKSVSGSRVKNYPVNVARNVARRGVETRLMLMADIELQPSVNLTDMFVELYAHRAAQGRRDKEVFVVPVFEVSLNETSPENVRQLQTLVASGSAVPFHIRRSAYECHQIPDLSQWWESNEGNKINVFKSTKWIRPCWEPVFVSDVTTPFHDERFQGYGKNKIQQVYEMCRQNYTFHILNNAFLIHSNISELSHQEWEAISDEVTRNNVVFQKFKEEMDMKYEDIDLRRYCNSPVYRFTSLHSLTSNYI